MKKHIFNDIEQEYEKAKIEFQTRDNFLAAKEIANQIEEYSPRNQDLALKSPHSRDYPSSEAS